MQADHRAGTLSQFLDQAGKNLKNMPACFQDLGLERIKDTRAYLTMLLEKLPVLSNALDALDRFERKIKMVPSLPGFRMPEEKLTRVIENHINCEMSILKADDILDQEIDAMSRLLEN